jgi:hypothetical protein
MKAVLIFLLAGLASAACPVYPPQGERYDTLQNGTVVLTWENNVLDKSSAPLKASRRDTLAISTPAGFKAWLQSSLADSALAFIGRIDSVIEKRSDGNSVGEPVGDTVVAGLTVSLTLNPRDTTVSGSRNYPFYARLRIDTLTRGTLPSKNFWIKGYRSPGCPMSLRTYKNLRFLNLSAGFASMKDLKLPPDISFYLAGQTIIPDAHWFDGRYLISPRFPGLRIDIREVLPAYPVTGILRRGVPGRPEGVSGKAYQPDGRRIEGPTGRKTTAPLLK